MHTSIRKSSGFTLVELIVAMVIAAILAAVAIPAYSNYVRKARRTEAKTALLDMASLEERYFSVNNQYSSTATDIGYAAWPVTVGSGSGDYSIAISNVAAAVAGTPGTPATYTLTATAINDQFKDTLCTTFTLTQAGQQTSSDTTNNSCWR
jgi:type IV pilus assembly protein PilE